MEKKNKKKLFAIIGASALAFVLTIALSVSITLAYFGSTGTESQSIKLGAGVVVADKDGQDGKVTLSQDVDNALPGQTIKLTVDAKIKASTKNTEVTNPTQQAAVLLMIKGDLKLTGTATDWAYYGTATDVRPEDAEEGWTAETYTVYLLGTKAAMTNVTATKDGADVAQFSGNYTISTTYDNTHAGTDVTSVDATIVAIQYGTTPGGVTESNLRFDDLDEIFEDIADVTFTEVTAE